VSEFLIRLIIYGVSLWIISYITPWIKFFSVSSLIISTIIIALLNALVKPFILILTFPLTILTLGIWIFFVNLFLFYMTSLIVPGFQINGFLNGLLSVIVFSILSTIISKLI
jgi:putative membrane protein